MATESLGPTLGYKLWLTLCRTRGPTWDQSCLYKPNVCAVAVFSHITASNKFSNLHVSVSGTLSNNSLFTDYSLQELASSTRFPWNVVPLWVVCATPGKHPPSFIFCTSSFMFEGKKSLFGLRLNSIHIDNFWMSNWDFYSLNDSKYVMAYWIKSCYTVLL
jgi:hypothetical protein